MNTPDPHRTTASMVALGWTAEQLTDLARRRARVLADMAWSMALIHPAWAPLRGETPTDRGPAMGMIDAELSRDLALPADPGDDDAGLVASAVPVHAKESAGDPDPAEQVLSQDDAADILDRQIAEFRARRWTRGGRR